MRSDAKPYSAEEALRVARELSPDGGGIFAREAATLREYARLQRPPEGRDDLERDVRAYATAIEETRSVLSGRGFCGDGNLAHMVARALDEAVQRHESALDRALGDAERFIAEREDPDNPFLGTLRERIEQAAAHPTDTGDTEGEG